MDAKPFWSHKPWWCQPWSILLTGVTAIALSWLGLHRWWFTLALGVVVLLWWVLFLVLVPASQGAASSGEEKGHDPSLG
jgi:membrane protein YdbS with pleckstrin-like domain